MKKAKSERKGLKEADSDSPDKRPPVKGGQAHAARHKTQDDNTSDWHAQLAEDRRASAKPGEPGSDPAGGLSSANSATADPFTRHKALGVPVPQVTRKI